MFKFEQSRTRRRFGSHIIGLQVHNLLLSIAILQFGRLTSPATLHRASRPAQMCLMHDGVLSNNLNVHCICVVWCM